MLFQQPNECIVDQFVGDAVDEKVGAFLDRGARGFQLSGVNSDAQFQPVTFRDDRVNNGPEFLDRVLGVDDVPDLDVIRCLFRQFLHELDALLRRLDFDDGRIAVELELRPRNTGDERAGHGDAGRFLDGVGELPHREVPHRSADIDHGGNPAPDVTRECIAPVALDPFVFVLVGTNTR